MLQILNLNKKVFTQHIFYLCTLNKDVLNFYYFIIQFLLSECFKILPMKKEFLFIFLFIFSLNAFSQNKLWTVGTAFTIPHKTIEISALRPARAGIGRKTELSMHPIGTFVLPHLYVKHIWGQPNFRKKKITVSSQHGIYYPSLALKLFQNNPIADIEPPQGSLPRNLAFRNEILISKYLSPPNHCSDGNYLFTLRIGIKNSLSSDKSLHPIIYTASLHHETMVLYPKPVWYIGLDFEASLSPTINIFADLEYRQASLFLETHAIESKAGIMGYSANNISAFFGAKASFEKMFQTGVGFKVFPILDISYTFKIKPDKTKEKGLFKNDPFNFYDFYENDELR